MDEPVTGGISRTLDGQFAPGHAPTGGGGNAHASAARTFQASMYECITPSDFKRVVNRLLAEAVEGKPWAVQYLMDRLLGKPKQSMDIEGVLNVLKLYAKEAPTEAV